MSDNQGTPAAAPSDPADGIPVVAIVGRPNVGKSCLFNCLALRRIAIVDPARGVTRDRVSTIIEDRGRMFDLWDTGGMGLASTEELAAEINTQIEIAIRRADLILLVVDAQAGLHPQDKAIADRLRRTGRPIILAVNKVDHPKHALAAAEFHQLGLEALVPISAKEHTGRTDLLELVVAALPRHTRGVPDPALRLAVVGQPNAGKSTLINTLAQQERMIVSETPGTTRDSVDVRFQINGRLFLAIDTAGIKRKSRTRTSVEFYGLNRAERAIRRSDVVVFMLDATQEIVAMDKRIAQQIEAQARPCVIAVNKWDLAEDVPTERFEQYLTDRLRGMSYAPLAFISALHGDNVSGLLKVADDLHRQAQAKVPTAQLNDLLQQAQARRPAPPKTGKTPHIMYAVQVAAGPPTFVLFCRHPKLFRESYARYLANFLRRNLPCSEIPLRLFFRPRPRGDSKGHTPAKPPPKR